MLAASPAMCSDTLEVFRLFGPCHVPSICVALRLVGMLVLFAPHIARQKVCLLLRGTCHARALTTGRRVRTQA